LIDGRYYNLCSVDQKHLLIVFRSSYTETAIGLLKIVHSRTTSSQLQDELTERSWTRIAA